MLQHQEADASAMIVEKGRSITVQVKGAGKSKYLASLRDTLEEIFDSYKVIKPDIKYEVLIPEEDKKDGRYRQYSDSETLLMLSEKVIIGFLKADRPFFDALSQTDIPLGLTADKYSLFSHNLMLARNTEFL